MPRMACPEEAHATLHVVQRGRERCACFSCAGDRLAYLELLRECALEAECSVHAWALMGNHVHLLFTSVRAHGAARLVPALRAMRIISLRRTGTSMRYGRSPTTPRP